jgi:two-component system sensor histidine kinase/response regulator
VPGIDLDQGLKMVRGKLLLYHSLLLKYVDLHGGTSGNFKRLIEAGNLIEAQRLAHSMIGAAGFLGAEGISLAARALEQGLKAKRGDEELQRLAADLEGRQAVLCLAVRGLPVFGQNSLPDPTQSLET